ncbi:Uncharacterised protein [Mycobacteroides abscessus subsp. massiliense]|nr:Uncharacterised protein [Mycobacteroides abscessus subsp. massiliense]
MYGFALASTATAWNSSSAASAASGSCASRAAANRVLASRIAAKSPAEMLVMASRTASSCIAAATDCAARASRMSMGLTMVCRPGWVWRPAAQLVIAQPLAGGQRPVHDGRAQGLIGIVAQ